MRARVTTTLDAPADAVWNAVKKGSTFAYVTRGVLGVDGDLPESIEAGETHTARLRFFHVLPGNRHTIYIDRVDDDARELYTREHGGLVRAWNHLIRVRPRGEDRCRYMDRIDIDAGLLTPVVWLVAHVFYRYRQLRWRKLARSLDG